jgi:hypothetical protein
MYGESEYIPAGERADARASFAVNELAEAVGVDRTSVEREAAAAGLAVAGGVDNRAAQVLVERLMRDRPLPDRQAALMRLGAFTPRSDTVEGVGDVPSPEESDRQAARADTPPDQLPSARSSYDPATQRPGP